jgi:ABC-type phosphate/phosphonate transport system substrate-binding protein
MGRGLIALIAAVVAAAMLVAGCGGSSDDSSAATSISKEEFIAKADAVCKKGNEALEKELFKFLRKNRKGGSLRKPSVEQNEKFIETVLIPNLQKEIKELKALGVPEGDEEKVDAMIAALEEGLETAEDETETVAAGTADMVFGIASRLAGEYGLETCGSR